jgi:hypothetical protein
MKVYGDLVVKGDGRALNNFIVALDQHLSNGWSRYREREAEVGRVALGPMYCFVCTAQGSRPASELWLATHSGGYLYVTNILAQEFSSLTYDQYNEILSDFYRACAKPAADGIPVSIKLGNPNPQLEDFLSPATARQLRSFSTLANRSILHPLDRQRWNEFLASAHREGAELNADMLQRWLIEEEKWSEDQAIGLAIEYEHARDLLATYESRPA